MRRTAPTSEEEEWLGRRAAGRSTATTTIRPAVRRSRGRALPPTTDVHSSWLSIPSNQRVRARLAMDWGPTSMTTMASAVGRIRGRPSGHLGLVASVIHGAHHHGHHDRAHDGDEDESDAGNPGGNEHDRDYEHGDAAGDHHPAVTVPHASIRVTVTLGRGDIELLLYRHDDPRSDAGTWPSLA